MSDRLINPSSVLFSLSLSVCLFSSLFALLSRKHNKVLERATQSLQRPLGADGTALPDYVSRSRGQVRGGWWEVVFVGVQALCPPRVSVMRLKVPACDPVKREHCNVFTVNQHKWRFLLSRSCTETDEELV